VLAAAAIGAAGATTAGYVAAKRADIRSSRERKGEAYAEVLNPVDPNDALTLYLFLPVTAPGGIKVRSSLEALLTDVRSTVGRNPQTGEIVDPDHSRTWLGALGYLSLVDQISSLLQVPRMGPGGNPFERLLIWDGSVLEDEAAALYAMRCAFVHSYGLLNEAPSSRQPRRARLLRHIFVLKVEGNDLVTLGDRRSEVVDGPLEKLPATEVDLISLGNVVEELVADLRSHHLAGDGLRIRSTIPMKRFVRACFFMHHDPIQAGHLEGHVEPMPG
jgi:hypothetical protein